MIWRRGVSKMYVGYAVTTGEAQVNRITVWGHSTTTWTKFYPILTTYTPRVNNCEHFIFYLHFVHVTKRGLSTDRPTSFCLRSHCKSPYFFM